MTRASSCRRLAGISVAALLLVAFCAPANAQEKKFKAV